MKLPTVNEQVSYKTLKESGSWNICVRPVSFDDWAALSNLKPTRAKCREIKSLYPQSTLSSVLRMGIYLSDTLVGTVSDHTGQEVYLGAAGCLPHTMNPEIGIVWIILSKDYGNYPGLDGLLERYIDFYLKDYKQIGNIADSRSPKNTKWLESLGFNIEYDQWVINGVSFHYFWKQRAHV